jgi:hypothetical protein
MPPIGAVQNYFGMKSYFLHAYNGHYGGDGLNESTPKSSNWDECRIMFLYRKISVFYVNRKYF